MLDTKVGTEKKDHPADVAKQGFEAMMKGEGGIIYGLRNKTQVAMSRVMLSENLAEKHREMAAPGTAEKPRESAEQKELTK